MFIHKQKSNKLNSGNEVCVKFVDDASAAASYDLKQVVEPVSHPYQQPVTFNQRTGHQVKQEAHTIQSLVNLFLEFTNRNSFVINKKKCEIMVFNLSNKYSFPPDVMIGNSDMINEVTHANILGLIVQSNLKWDKNTEHIFKKAASKLWLLRRLQRINLDIELMVDFYKKEIRCILEYSVPVWYSSITIEQSKHIEKIQ